MKILNKIGAIPSIIITFFFTMIGWVIFRLETLEGIFTYLEKLFVIDFSSRVETIPSFYFILFLSILFSFIASNKYGNKVVDFIYNKRKYSLLNFSVLSISAGALLIISLGTLFSDDFNPFVYFRF